MEDDLKPENSGRHAHFDCFGGATTSAILAACLHHKLVKDVQNSIREAFPVFQLEKLQVSKSQVAGMPATVVNVVRAENEHPSRRVGDSINAELMLAILGADIQNISKSVREKSQAVLTELKTAHIIVSGSLHERLTVSLNEMIEILSILLVLERLGVETVSCSPLPLGEGSVWTEKDGLLPIPSPMTLQLLVGMPTCSGPNVVLDRDMVTPTAAALLRVLTGASSSNNEMTEKPGCFTATSIGVGADPTGEGDSSPRVLRVLVGDTHNRDGSTRSATIKNDNSTIYSSLDWKMDQLTQFEANLDDMTAEALAFALERLIDNGALDAWIVPIVMKKGRAAHTLCCLCRPQDSHALLKIVFRHTTTLGVRIHDNVARAALRRSFVTVESPFHDSTIQVKVGYLGEEIASVKAEYDDCARISRETDVPIKQVGDDAVTRARRKIEESS